MTASSLSLEGFRDLLDRFGGDLTSWPARDRLAADSLLAISRDAQTLLAQANVVDGVLSATPKAPAGLADRIVAAALDQPPSRKN